MIKLQKLNGFILKVLAMVFMTLDHVGLLLMSFNLADSPLGVTGYVFRCIGRVAFPLFVLLLVEGIRNTSSVRNYLLRIGILAGLLMVSEIIIYYFIDSAIGGAESPLIDLLLCGLTLGLLHRKDKWSFMAILPIAFILLTAGIQIYEKTTSMSVLWLPFYVRPGYSIFALTLSLGFYYSFNFVNRMYKKNEMDVELFKDTPQYRSMVNVTQSVTLFLVNIIIFILSYISYNNVYFLDIFTASVQTWSIVAIIFILFYNGERGYNKVWFKYFCYAYFPVHIVIIFAIFYVIYML
jgi:hypothetical protein